MLVRCDMMGDQPEDFEQQMRWHRDAFLAESDWAMASDAPTDKEAWATYRQALRDFPSTWTPSETVEFPDPPTGGE